MTLSTEDLIAINTLYSTYNHRVDMTGDAAGVANCFVENGVYDHGRFGKFEGRAKITAFMQSAIDEQEAGFQHWNGNLLIDGSGDNATATAYVMTVDARGAQPIIARANIYRDVLVRTAEGWRFVSRRVGYPISEFRK
jgi:hypothetical protein